MLNAFLGSTKKQFQIPFKKLLYSLARARSRGESSKSGIKIPGFL